MVQEETVPPSICDIDAIFAVQTPRLVTFPAEFITGPAIYHGNSFDHQKTNLTSQLSFLFLFSNTDPDTWEEDDLAVTVEKSDLEPEINYFPGIYIVCRENERL